MGKKQAQIQTKAQEEIVSAETTPNQGETKTSVEPVQLTIADLQLLARIVDLASRRGAFQAGELSQVGDAYNKLTGFLSYVESVQSKEKAAQPEDSTV